MNYKVCYEKNWSTDGTFYDQRITVKLSHAELDAFNAHVRERKRKLLEKPCRDALETNYLMFVGTLHKGKNFTNLSTCEVFKCFFNLLFYKRIKDRNTLIFVQFSDN